MLSQFIAKDAYYIGCAHPISRNSPKNNCVGGENLKHLAIVQDKVNS